MNPKKETETNEPSQGARLFPAARRPLLVAGALVALALGGAGCAAGAPDDTSGDDALMSEGDVGEAEQAIKECAPGLAAKCGDDDPIETWTGRKCCVADSPICVPGSQASCGNGDPMEHWTGLVCCVENKPMCGPGLEAACGGEDPAEHWTGVKCCIDGHPMCVPGKVASCGGDDPAEHWNGIQCCVEASHCTNAKASACTGTGKHWTGTKCCVD